MIVGGIYPGSYYLTPSVATTHECWAAVGAVSYDWTATPDLTDNAWEVLVGNTYNEYCLGENFTLTANEEFPLIAVEDRPLVVPADSGFSIP